MRQAFLTGVALLLILTPVHGKIYKWTDHNGTIHFTDNIWSIPPAYRQQVEERASTPASPQGTPKRPSLPASTVGPGEKCVEIFVPPIASIQGLLSQSVEIATPIWVGKDFASTP